MSAASDWFRDIAATLDRLDREPYGPTVGAETKSVAGHACVTLCDGDQDKARSLWKQIARDCGGYMPQAAAAALIRATSTTNLVPDIEAPEPS